MRYCDLCVLPDTRPNLVIGDDGVCNACKSHGSKPSIDWRSREEDFAHLVTHAKRQSSRYDCLIPVSGGKDSTWQVVKCLEYGLTPLAVTWRPPARTEVGQRNLENLIRLGVDHIDYTINPKVEARFMLKAFERFGSTAVPMHLAIFNITPAIAARFRIPLVIWGENSAFEYGNTDDAHTGFLMDEAWLNTYGVTHGTKAEDWVDEDLTERDLSAYFAPDADELKAAGTRAIFLGYYFEWDPTKTFEVAKAHGFSNEATGARTGLYDFADIDDDFISIHHWLKWYKFGFTRLSDNLSLEIRNGRIVREEALEILRRAGDQTPHADIEKFCAFAEISKDRFFSIAEKFRNLDIWKKTSDGCWFLPDFIFSDWVWSRSCA